MVKRSMVVLILRCVFYTSFINVIQRINPSNSDKKKMQTSCMNKLIEPCVLKLPEKTIFTINDFFQGYG